MCLENKNCLLKEHTLYTKIGYDKHLKSGDIDSEGQIYFFHPFCHVTRQPHARHMFVTRSSHACHTFVTHLSGSCHTRVTRSPRD